MEEGSVEHPLHGPLPPGIEQFPLDALPTTAQHLPSSSRQSSPDSFDDSPPLQEMPTTSHDSSPDSFDGTPPDTFLEPGPSTSHAPAFSIPRIASQPLRQPTRAQDRLFEGITQEVNALFPHRNRDEPKQCNCPNVYKQNVPQLPFGFKRVEITTTNYMQFIDKPIEQDANEMLGNAGWKHLIAGESKRRKRDEVRPHMSVRCLPPTGHMYHINL